MTVISTQAAQALSYRPANASTGLLFVSARVHFAEGKAIKGGIPVCRPWFGPELGHRGMLRVETANAGSGIIMPNRAARHRLRAVYTLEETG